MASFSWPAAQGALSHRYYMRRRLPAAASATGAVGAVSEFAQVARARLSTTRQYAGVLWAESAEEQVLKQSQTCGTILDCCALGFLLISWSEFCFHLKQIVDGFTRGDCFCNIEDGGAVDGGGCFSCYGGRTHFQLV